jgi:hypothetical protein
VADGNVLPTFVEVLEQEAEDCRHRPINRLRKNRQRTARSL